MSGNEQLQISLPPSYDKVSADTASSEPKNAKFQSCHRVVNKIQTPHIMYNYDTQSDLMHTNCPKHSNFTQNQ